MDSVRSNPLVCEACQKEFSSISNRNKHQRKFHDEGSTKVDRIKHIRCPICTTENNEEKFSFYNKLDEHLTNLHGIQIKETNFTFKNVKEFEAWHIKENRDADYVCVRRYKIPNGDTAVKYLCNRSRYRAFQSVIERKRQMKSGGSIHIQGVCPSRIIVKILRDGLVKVQYIDTHVGHEDELRAKRQLKSQQDMIVEKLNMGVSKKRKILDAREIQDDKLQRMNVITRDLPSDIEERRNIALEEHITVIRDLRSLDGNTFDRLIAGITKLKSDLKITDQHVSKKREVDNHRRERKFIAK